MAEFHKTKTTDWDGNDEKALDRWSHMTGPPWYVIRITNEAIWSRPWFHWRGYLRPPTVFLTRRLAEARAVKLRKQWKCRIEVIRVDLDPDA